MKVLCQSSYNLKLIFDKVFKKKNIKKINDIKIGLKIQTIR